MKVVSTGTAEGEAPRTMEAFASITPIYTGFGAAIMAVNGTNFGNNFQVNGQNGNDGDIYILNGNLVITASPVIYGNVYVPNGSATTSNNNEIKGDLSANGTITIDNPGLVSGNAKSTTGNVAGSGRVGGDATATGTVTVVTSMVRATQSTNPGPVDARSHRSRRARRRSRAPVTTWSHSPVRVPRPAPRRH